MDDEGRREGSRLALLPYTTLSQSRAREVYRYLRDEVLAKDREKVTYGEAAQAIGCHPRVLSQPLGVIQEQCRAMHAPTITVLVVDAATGLPNAGCDATNPADVAEKLAAVQSTTWPPRPWW
ncbi:MAG: hypothetical protein KIT11_00455 [Fimbriimonadaceae bacterium]|nr:hypothetical protein [Fimbriimonadaceae bacterium]QYK55156.1 MAG: hypothetical protein KF733_09080 [Fimbriimonadaceae bacterium]